MTTEYQRMRMRLAEAACWPDRTYFEEIVTHGQLRSQIIAKDKDELRYLRKVVKLLHEAGAIGSSRKFQCSPSS